MIKDVNISSANLSRLKHSDSHHLNITTYKSLSDTRDQVLRGIIRDLPKDLVAAYQELQKVNAVSAKFDPKKREAVSEKLAAKLTKMLSEQGLSGGGDMEQYLAEKFLPGINEAVNKQSIAAVCDASQKFKSHLGAYVKDNKPLHESMKLLFELDAAMARVVEVDPKSPNISYAERMSKKPKDAANLLIEHFCQAAIDKKEGAKSDNVLSQLVSNLSMQKRPEL